jgi:drug/metabolite transporter (DMT)-like permease
MQILASDTVGPLVLVLFLAPIIVGMLCLIILLIKRPRSSSGRRSRWGLVLGLLPTIFGAFLILMLLTTRGGAPQFFYIVAALPMLVGVRILQIWGRS